ncbi:hypothetical protein N0V88_001550 [Collariella sp. IMI 366227]|nr:hypothetical protein N0V88_001550 [Collariella sp. IMI 366227]
MAIPCMSNFGRFDSTYGTLLTDGMTDGLLMHEAWKVSWAASDTSTLSLSLPALTSGWTLDTWTPGETVIRVTPNPTDPTRDGAPHENDKFLTIGVPLLIVGLLLAIGGCCGMCCLMTKYQERLGLKTPIELETPAVELERRERRDGGLPT